MSISSHSAEHHASRLPAPVRLLRILLTLALALLSVPFLTLSTAYAEGESPDATSVVTTEVTDPPADPAPAEEPAAEEPAAEPIVEPATEPAPAEEPATEPVAPAEEPAAEEPAAEEPVVEEATAPAADDEPTKPGKKPTATSSSLQAAALPTADCTVTDFTQNTVEGGGGSWINGALNQQNSNYAEGDYVPQKIDLSGLVPGEYTIGFSFDRTKNGKYAYDYVSDLYIDGSAGATATWSSSTADFDGPAPTSFAVTVFVTITFTIVADDETAVIGWNGHISSELDYGPNSSAGSINGAPYHFSIVSTDGEFGCDGGNRDNQLMADAVDFGTITIVKDAQPDSAQDFHFTLVAPNDLDTAFDLDDDADATLPSSVSYHVPPGTTTAAEVDIADGWQLTDISCTKAGSETATSVSVLIADDETVTCTFTNSQQSSLEVDKYWVINGGAPVAEGSEPASLGLGAQLTVDGNNEAWSTEITGYLQGTTVSLDESVTFGNDLCHWTDTDVQGRVTEANGQQGNAPLPYDLALSGGDNHATITNTVTCDGELILRKVVENPNGGTAGADDFTLIATPQSGGDPLSTIGSEDGTSFVVDPEETFDLSETGGPDGYTLTGIDCGGGDTTTVQVPAGETVTCTFTNADAPGSLELTKIVDANETGDDTPASAWHLSATPVGIDGQAVIEGDGHAEGATHAGTYQLAEEGPATHTAGDWACETDEGDPVTVTASDTIQMGIAQDVSCTITNVAIQPTLTLVKVVDPGDTGDETPASAFTLTATPEGIDDQSVLSGPGGASSAVKVGAYALSETGPDTYAPAAAGWECVDQNDDPVTVTATDRIGIGLAMDVTCTIVNVAIPSEWMVSKTSDPASGATVQPGEQIDYTVTLTKVGDGVPVEDIVVQDTLTGIEDGWVSGLEDDGASISNGVITWPVAELGDEPLTLTYTITVGEGAWNATIVNQVTPGPVPCVDEGDVDCDETVHYTPHYTLDKDVALLPDPGDGDSLAEPGEQLEYSLTIENDTEHATVDTVISDDLSDVLDNATMVTTDAELAAQGLSLDGDTLTWTVTGLEPGASLTVSYVVQIGEGQFGVTLHNVATPEPDEGGECVPPGDLPGAGPDDNAECETTTETPPVTTMVVEKRDLETDEVLADATFELFYDADNPGNVEGDCVFTSPATVGEGAESLGTATTGDDGHALFAELQHGCYLLVEVTPPPGYELPEIHVMGIQIDESNFVGGGLMSPIVVTDFAEGQLAIVAKRQFEFIDGAWEESDGVVGFGARVKYVVRVEATGPKNFHDVLVTDYVPGFSPEDTTSTVQASLVPGSAVCAEGLTCTASVDPATQLVTWDIGDLEPAPGDTMGGTAEMEVLFPQLEESQIPDPGETFEATLWNVGFLEWDEATPLAPATTRAFHAAGRAGLLGTVAAVELPMTHHTLRSNEVVISALVSTDELPNVPEQPTPPEQPQQPVGPLPQTGAPVGLLQLAALCGGLIAAGIALTRRSRRVQAE